MMKPLTSKAAARNINAFLAPLLADYNPPENLTVSEWADKYRRLPRKTSAEPGRWRTKRTPYLQEPMDSITNPNIHRIVMVAASQVGKSELLLNAIGYIIDQDPCSIVFVQPTLDNAKNFSRLRIAPMIQDSDTLHEKVADVKSRDSGNTILQKSFPGGMLTITGSNSAAALASTPARVILGDERDRWAVSAGTEGDPWALAEARQTTFYNAKAIEVSTPTIKGESNIESSYNLGTRERWCHRCPACGEFHEITFSRIHFKHSVTKIKGKKIYTLDDPPEWTCPSCGCLSPEGAMRQQPAKWIAENPDALHKGIRSFWLNAFSSPWTSWENIVLRFLEAQGDPKRLQVVFNTLLGELWEDRGELDDEETMLSRREDYGVMEDGRTPVDLPAGVLVLTCGVDTQDDRLEFEVVGHGRFGETWGIHRGFIPGRPDLPSVWEGLDAVIDRTYYFVNGRGLRVSVTFVDSGGHYTQDVYSACRMRFNKMVFAIKGANTENAPYVKPPTKVPIRQNKKVTCWLYSIGVDAGKADIMNNLKVQEAGPKYCHFPLGDRGYDHDFFNGLMSEKLVLKWTSKGKRWAWERIPGHVHNEPLDCRNYANAARQILQVDLDQEERRLKGNTGQKSVENIPKRPKKRRMMQDDW